MSGLIVVDPGGEELNSLEEAELLDRTIALAEGLQVVQSKLAVLTAERERRGLVTGGIGEKNVGVPFGPRSKLSTRRTQTTVVDMARRSRGENAHRGLERDLAVAAAKAGLRPLGPDPEDPQFDLAWWDSGYLVVIEAKSVTRVNHSTQLRLGLGQVLDYAEGFRERGIPVRPVLAVETPPAPRWVSLAARHGVRLVWPDLFGTLKQWTSPIRLEV